MKTRYKPEGYTSVARYLIVDNASRTIDFLTRVFGAKKLSRFEAPDGRLRHADGCIDDTVVMMGDATEGWPPVPCHVHVYVPDVDAAYRRALEAGATSVQEPVKRDDSDKRGGFKDPGGTTWWVGTKIG